MSVLNLFEFCCERSYSQDCAALRENIPQDVWASGEFLSRLLQEWRKLIICEWAMHAANLKNCAVGVLSFDETISLKSQHPSACIVFTGRVYLPADSAEDAETLIETGLLKEQRDGKKHTRSPFDKMLYRPHITRMLTAMERLAEIQPD